MPGAYRYCTRLVEAVRREPDVRTERVTEAMLWDELVIHEDAGDWLRVALPSQAGYGGWMPRGATAGGFRPDGEPGIVRASCAPLSPVGGEPGTCCGVLWMGSRVAVAHLGGPTAVVRGPDGREYLMPSHCMRSGEAAHPGAMAAERALAMVGVPYLWGGMTFRGIDCSGLAQVALRAAGIAVRRDADMQFEDGVAVRREELRAGDTAFLERDGRITHVMMMIDAHRVVHAYGKADAVTVDALSDDAFAGLIAGFRRHV